MKNLSEIDDDTLLCVCTGYDEWKYTECRIMSKRDLLTECKIGDVESAFIADRYVPRFDLTEIIERMGEDDVYEDWADDVLDDLQAAPETKAFLELVEKTFDKYPTYYDGEQICLREDQYR